MIAYLARRRSYLAAIAAVAAAMGGPDVPRVGGSAGRPTDPLTDDSLVRVQSGASALKEGGCGSGPA